jgi:hypothetical protein
MSWICGEERSFNRFDSNNSEMVVGSKNVLKNDALSSNMSYFLSFYWEPPKGLTKLS